MFDFEFAFDADDPAFLVIYDSVLFNRTGQVRRWAEAVQRGFTNNARKFAPRRSGALERSIWGYVERVGPVHLQSTIRVDAKHAKYVLRGTTGPIMTTKRWLGVENKPMKLRAGGGYPALTAFVVEGQEQQNFLAEAARATAVRHSSLRGWDPEWSVVEG